MSRRIIALAGKILFYAVANRIPPALAVGYRLRQLLAPFVCESVGGNNRIGAGVHLTSACVLKYRAGVGSGCQVLGGGHVELGKRLRMGPQCMFITGDHNLPSPGESFETSGSRLETIVVEEDVYMGARVIVLAGVRIGRGAALAAGAVVTRNVEPGQVVGGVPARLLKSLDDRAESGEAPSRRPDTVGHTDRP